MINMKTFVHILIKQLKNIRTHFPLKIFHMIWYFAHVLDVVDSTLV